MKIFDSEKSLLDLTFNLFNLAVLRWRIKIGTYQNDDVSRGQLVSLEVCNNAPIL